MSHKKQGEHEKNGEGSILIHIKTRILHVLLCLKRISLKELLLRGWKKRLAVLCLLLGVALAMMGCASILGAAMCDKVSDRIVSPQATVLMDGEFDCVLVLGCKVYSDGSLSSRLADRMQIGTQLKQSGVGSVLLLSGDRRDDGSYDEVGAMRMAAISAGVTENEILCDGRGYSTYESLVRAKELYGVERIVIVTQEYHLYRALYIAERLGLEAYGVSADLRPYSDSTRCEIREVFARVKDVYFAQVQPAVDLKEP